MPRDTQMCTDQQIKEYRDQLVHSYYAAERGVVDDVIDSAETRIRLIDALAVLRTKHVSPPSRKHGNQPQ